MKLPQEVLAEVLGHTSPRTASRLLATNKNFREEYYPSQAEAISRKKNIQTLRKAYVLSIIKRKRRIFPEGIGYIHPKLSFLFGPEFPREEGRVIMTYPAFDKWFSFFINLNFSKEESPGYKAVNYLEQILGLPLSSRKPGRITQSIDDLLIDIVPGGRGLNQYQPQLNYLTSMLDVLAMTAEGLIRPIDEKLWGTYWKDAFSQPLVYDPKRGANNWP